LFYHYILLVLFTDKQKWIGYADVKSAPVYFYVTKYYSFNYTRESNFYSTNNPIPFELARVNEGNAMNLTSGIFTAPRPGIYFFSFTGVARIIASSSWGGSVVFQSYLFLNGKWIGGSKVQKESGPVRQYSPLTLQSTLNLKKGDRVWVQISYSGSDSFLKDDQEHFTHFTGFMLEEEIVASL
jgi:hypothetical protein